MLTQLTSHFHERRYSRRETDGDILARNLSEEGREISKDYVPYDPAFTAFSRTDGSSNIGLDGCVDP